METYPKNRKMLDESFKVDASRLEYQFRIRYPEVLETDAADDL